MKTKSLLVTLGIAAVAVVVFFFVRAANASRPDKTSVHRFLVAFNKKVKAGKSDEIRACFDLDRKPEALTRIVGILTNKVPPIGDVLSLTKVNLIADSATVKIANDELAEAVIPVVFTGTYDGSRSVLKVRMRRVSGDNYKIVQVDASQMAVDYMNFRRFPSMNIFRPDTERYGETTMKAFATAKSLKAKYDTVIWFAHMGDNTYYYVVNGQWDLEQNFYPRYRNSPKKPYKMGLVGPDLKEVIPAQYTMIHTINDLFPGMVEVEKDGKKGLFDLNGKNVLPVNYDQIILIKDNAALAVLRNGNDYYYLQKDMTVSDKVDLKVANFFPKIKDIGRDLNVHNRAFAVPMEYNSRDEYSAIYLPPSYLVDLGMTGRLMEFKNPFRKVGDYSEDFTQEYNIGYTNTVNLSNNWLSVLFYSIEELFISGRGQMYNGKNLVILDKKKNKVYSYNFETDYRRQRDFGESTAIGCDVNNIRVLNDSMYEVKTGAVIYADMYDPAKVLVGGTYYHYLIMRGGKLEELPNERYFGFTKYRKMDDSYLNGCYELSIGRVAADKDIKINRITPDLLLYIKNEIYAEYGYRFKDTRWQHVFEDMPAYCNKDGKPIPGKVSVDDSLTDVDKYNINWITQKLKGAKTSILAAK